MHRSGNPVLAAGEDPPTPEPSSAIVHAGSALEIPEHLRADPFVRYMSDPPLEDIANVDALLEAGFAKEGRLALETIICPQNYEDLPDMWRWMRQQGIIPEVEIPTIHGRAAVNHMSLSFDEAEASAKYRALFEELLRIDETEFGFTWIPHPPFPAGSCTLFETNCYVNDRGGVQPCAGVDKEFGIIGRDGTLADIVTTAEFQGVRRVRERVAEPCASCDLIDVCYGCRGASYQATGDMFAADPVCFRNQDVTPPKRVTQGCEGCSCGS